MKFDIVSSTEGFARDLLDGFPIVSAILEWNNHTESKIKGQIDKVSSQLDKAKDSEVKDMCTIATSKYLIEKKDFNKGLDGLSNMSKYIINAYFKIESCKKFSLTTAYSYLRGTPFFDSKKFEKIKELDSFRLQYDSGDAVKKVSGGFPLRALLLLFPPAYVFVALNGLSGDTQKLSYKGWKSKTDLQEAIKKVRTVLKDEIMYNLNLIAEKNVDSAVGQIDDDYLTDASGKKYTESEYNTMHVNCSIMPKMAKVLLSEIGYLCRGVLVAADKVSRPGLAGSIKANLKET